MLNTVANKVFMHLAMIDRPSTLTHAHCKNRLVVLTAEWLPWLYGLLW